MARATPAAFFFSKNLVYVIKKQYLCTRICQKNENMKNRMFNFTPPVAKMLHLSS